MLRTPPIVAAAVVLAHLLVPASARFTFKSGSVQNVSIPVATMTTFLGPQLGDPGLQPVTGPVRYFSAGDPCRAESVPDSVAGCIVFVTVSGMCPDFIVYDNFAAKKAAAVVQHSPFVPGRKAFARSMYDNWIGVRPNTMLFAESQITPRLLNPALRAENLTATLMPDRNPWIDMYRSWSYNAFTSSVPMGFLMVVLFQSVTSLIGHVSLIYYKYVQKIPESGRSAPRLLGFLLRNATSLHVVCVLQIVSKTVLIVIMLTGPYNCSAVLPYEVQQFFYSHLIGVEVAIIIITAVYYHRIISSTDATTRSLMFEWIPATMISVLAVVLDTVMTSIRALYYDVIYPKTVVVARSYNTAFLFLSGSYYLISAVRWQMQFRWSKMSPAIQRTMEDPVMQSFLFRMSLHALLTSIFIFGHTMTTFLLTIQSSWIFVPDNYGTMFSLLLTFKCAHSMFITQMAVPKSRSNTAGNTTSKASRLVTKAGHVTSRTDQSREPNKI